MQRTLTTSILVIIAMVAMASATIATTSALSVGGGVTLTESANGVSMGSRIDACRKYTEKCEETGRLGFTYKPIASWFSSTGMMPFLVMTRSAFREAVGPKSVVYRAAVDFNNVTNIVQVELTPDHGLTTWEATNVALKGYQVEIPYLPSGGYGLEWKVTSRDKHNRLMIVFIPISWSSNRTNGVVQQVMVQSAPDGSCDFTDEQWVSMLSPAFQPATALPDPGYLAKRAAQRQVLAQMTQPAAPADPPPAFTPAPAPAPKPAVEPHRPRPIADQPKPAVEQREEPKDDDGFVPDVPENDPEVYDLDGEYQLVLTGSVERSFKVNLSGKVAQGSRVVFDRNGKEALSANITDVSDGRIFAEVESVGSKGIQPGDKIIFDLEERQ